MSKANGWVIFAIATPAVIIVAFWFLGAHDRSSKNLAASSPTTYSSVRQRNPLAELIEIGTVPAGDKLEQVFVLQNKGSHSVKITGIQSSCSCTIVKKQLVGRTLAPNEKISFRVGFDTMRSPGEFFESIGVFVDDGKEPTYAFAIHGVIGKAFGIFAETSRFDLGIHPISKQNQIEFFLCTFTTRHDSAPPYPIAESLPDSAQAIVNILHSESTVSWELDRWILRCPVKVNTTSGKEPGPYTIPLAFSVRTVDGKAELTEKTTIVVSGVRASLVALPYPGIFFGFVARGRAKTLTIPLTCRGDETAVTVSNNWISPSFRTTGQGDLNLDVFLYIPTQAGLVEESVTLRTKSSSGEFIEQTIPIFGLVK